MRHIWQVTRTRPARAEVSTQHKIELVQDMLDAATAFLDNKEDDNVIVDE